MNQAYYTAEFRTENKTFEADTLEEAKEHARVIGYGEKPEKVRPATEGEIEGQKARLARHSQALRYY